MIKKATVHLENGKKISINANNNSTENKYIQSVQLNNKKYDNHFFKFNDLTKGADILFEMQAMPKIKATIPRDKLPYSFSK